jgi:NAD(P)-dependent dehydrogenase (short-subunit alcohol dehydrogenase family)/enamine deaminase RidA (YjgF/YER057c/UK114 family)
VAGRVSFASPGVALISGCSTGIGRQVARILAERGHTVVAGARRPATLDDLAAKHPDHLHPVEWDVADAEATRRAVTGTIQRHGGIDLLVNNAGYGQMGPVIELSREEWSRQLQTNVVGLADASALAARSPGGMIERRRGRIVNIGSIVGRLVLPFGGAYCASKHAVEAVSDALRMELAPFGIDVVLVEPGPVISSFGANARETVREMMSRENSPYEYLRPVIEKRTRISQEHGTPAEACARVVVRVATMKRPPTRILVTPQAKLLLWARRLLPDRALDILLKGRFSLRGRAPEDQRDRTLQGEAVVVDGRPGPWSPDSDSPPLPVNPESLGQPRGYSNGLLFRSGRTLFVAGQVAWDREHRIVGGEDLAAQFDAALGNVLKVVREAGGTPDKIGRLRIYVSDREKYLACLKELGRAYRKHMGRHYPAMALVEVARLLEEGALVEIEAEAIL